MRLNLVISVINRVFILYLYTTKILLIRTLIHYYAVNGIKQK
jgi:hypothetical protein